MQHALIWLLILHHRFMLLLLFSLGLPGWLLWGCLIVPFVLPTPHYTRFHPRFQRVLFALTPTTARVGQGTGNPLPETLTLRLLIVSKSEFTLSRTAGEG